MSKYLFLNMLWPYLIVSGVFITGWKISGGFAFLKKKWLRSIVVFITSVIITNVSLALCSKNIGTGITTSPSSRSYKTICGKVNVSAFGHTNGDHGPVTVIITIDNKVKFKMASYFNYDGFHNEDPASVHFAFKNFDPFVDLAIKTDLDKCFISGFNGRISQ